MLSDSGYFGNRRMGVQPCPLPTAVLSAQTGYSSYYCDDYTDRMELIYKEWDKMQVHFDGIYTGFMSGEHQIRKVLEFLDIFIEGYISSGRPCNGR